MSAEKPIMIVKVVKVGDHVHLGGSGPPAGRGVTVLAIDEDWVAVDAGKYGEIGCPIDDLVVPDCAHCCDDPPHGHQCPHCGRITDRYPDTEESTQ